jgi:hypothetical protein
MATVTIGPLRLPGDLTLPAPVLLIVGDARETLTH